MRGKKKKGILSEIKPVDAKQNKSFREKLRGLNSMKLRVFLAILFTGIVLTFFAEITIRAFYIDRSVNAKITEVKEYADRLAAKLISNAYLAQGIGTSDVDKELAAVSEIYEGRVLIVNSNLKIVYDSFGTEVGKTLISEEAINAVRGSSNQYVDRENQYVELTESFADALPLLDSNIALSGAPEGAAASSGAIIINSSIAGIYDMVDAIDQRIMFMAIVLGLSLVGFAYLFSSRLTKPLKQVTKSIKHVTEGYMNDPIQGNSYIELQRITDALNELLDKIRKMEDSRQEFVSNVSHELKTPITSIKVLADSLLMQGDAPVELYREFMSDINDEIDRENKIINDLLALVKLDKKSGELHVEEVNINELLEVILKRIKPIAKQRNIELILESYRPVLAEIDEVKLSLALSNLIENAVKYNRDAGWVHVSLNADHKFFFVKVSDSGVGIPADEQSMIFERFYRVDKTRSRETGGTGLGLAITKSVVLMHNGTIKVYSEEGEGTTFSVRIPLSYIPGGDDV